MKCNDYTELRNLSSDLVYKQFRIRGCMLSLVLWDVRLRIRDRIFRLVLWDVRLRISDCILSLVLWDVGLRISNYILSLVLWDVEFRIRDCILRLVLWDVSFSYFSALSFSSNLEMAVRSIAHVKFVYSMLCLRWLWCFHKLAVLNYFKNRANFMPTVT
jgi:hypothetical protein